MIKIDRFLVTTEQPEIDNMATREDNLKKKINDELENVAGGSFDETAADTCALKRLGLRIAEKSAEDLSDFSKFSDAAIEVFQIFKRYGIRVDQY